MSLMERRLQLLLDEARYDRVAREAERSGRSVAAVIREAIDYRFDTGTTEVQMAAATDLLAATSDPGPGRGEDPEDLKAAYAAELDSKVVR